VVWRLVSRSVAVHLGNVAVVMCLLPERRGNPEKNRSVESHPNVAKNAPLGWASGVHANCIICGAFH
jgi:hypothetical protein